MVQRTRLLLNLAFTHIHDWLPPCSTNHSFRSACEKAGVSKIAFLRHGKTAPKPDNGLDFDRVLTDLGREQAKEAGSSFGKNNFPFFSSALVSPAPRTVETAELFLQAAGTEDRCEIKTSQGLYDGTMHPEGSKIFQKIGYAPLTDYVDCNDDQDREMIRRLLGSYASTVKDAVRDVLLESSSASGEDSTLWVVGHAIYLPAATLGVATELGCSDSGLDVILSSNTKEAEGYLIDIDKLDTSYLARPSS